MLIIKFIFISSFLILFSCALPQKPTLPESAPTLYQQGLSLFKDKKYFDALPLFQKVIDKYPLTQYAALARLRMADSYLYQKKYSDAIFYYEEFKKLHPFHLEIPYAIFQMGMTHFKQILPFDRDQDQTRKALIQFENLLSQYPESHYAKKVKEKLGFCKERLALHEFYIAHFYYKRKRYHATLQRLEEILKRYPSSNPLDEVLFYLGKCYLYLGNKKEALSAFSTLIERYPQSVYTSQAKSILSTISSH